ncbi:MAG: phage tail protein [Phormidesmis sp. CAN_BIN44]|nr:phage tail protein [Phormidesmis sp. CAN_BIN44]
MIEACEVTAQQWGAAKSGLVVRTKIPGNVKTNNVTLRRGMTRSTTLWKWFESVQRGNWAKQQRDGSLTIYNQQSVAQAVFQFQSAWPISYSLTDLSAGSNDIEIEEMELAIATFTRTQ